MLHTKIRSQPVDTISILIPWDQWEENCVNCKKKRRHLMQKSSNANKWVYFFLTNIYEKKDGNFELHQHHELIKYNCLISDNLWGRKSLGYCRPASIDVAISTWELVINHYPVTYNYPGKTKLNKITFHTCYNVAWCVIRRHRDNYKGSIKWEMTF
jgi:hypothetical protein